MKDLFIKIIMIFIFSFIFLSFSPPMIKGDVKLSKIPDGVKLCFSSDKNHILKEIKIFSSTQGSSTFALFNISNQTNYCFLISKESVFVEKFGKPSIQRGGLFFRTNVLFEYIIKTNHGNYHGMFMFIDKAYPNREHSIDIIGNNIEILYNQ